MDAPASAEDIRFGLGMECMLQVPQASKAIARCTVDAQIGDTVDPQEVALCHLHVFFGNLIRMLKRTTSRTTITSEVQWWEGDTGKINQTSHPLGSTESTAWALCANTSVQLFPGEPLILQREGEVVEAEELRSHLVEQDAVLVTGLELQSPMFDVRDCDRLHDIVPRIKGETHLVFNSATSTHIHVSSHWLRDPQVLMQLVCNWALFEVVLLAMCDGQGLVDTPHRGMPFWCAAAELGAIRASEMSVADFCDLAEGSRVPLTVQNVMDAHHAASTPSSLDLDLQPALDGGESTGKIVFSFSHSAHNMDATCALVDVLVRLVHASIHENACVRMLQASSLPFRLYAAALLPALRLSVPQQALEDLTEAFVDWLEPFGAEGEELSDLRSTVTMLTSYPGQ